jgi:hypothetical protein
MQKLTTTDPETKSPDLVAENLARLKALFPELVTEGPDGVAVNLDVLKQLLGDRTVTDAEEKYGLNWHGKRRARQLALTPSTGTLRPCPEDSVDWDTTQNLMIEGDNLEVLKLLQKSYAHLAALQNTTITNQNTQILRLQKVLEELMGDVVKLRVGLAENEQVQREDTGASRVREELGRQFIAEVGTFGRVLAAAQFGMPAEMVELAEVVQASPERMDAMKAPDVRRMLRDEKTRKELAELLLMAARSAPTANAPTVPEAAAGAA